VERLITHVVPILLAPLEGLIAPALIHGDFWEGNIDMCAAAGEVCVFDASACYAHAEMDVAMWRGKINNVVNADVYTDAYLDMVGQERSEGFEDQGRLYAAYLTLHGGSFREE